MSDIQDPIQEAIAEISRNHRKIIDDWCKAYLAQLYEEGVEIKPGCFILCEREFHQHNGKMCKTYWFELKVNEDVCCRS